MLRRIGHVLTESLYWLMFGPDANHVAVVMIGVMVVGLAVYAALVATGHAELPEPRGHGAPHAR